MAFFLVCFSNFHADFFDAPVKSQNVRNESPYLMDNINSSFAKTTVSNFLRKHPLSGCRPGDRRVLKRPFDEIEKIVANDKGDNCSRQKKHIAIESATDFLRFENKKSSLAPYGDCG